jgi:hypothetical protein
VTLIGYRFVLGERAFEAFAQLDEEERELAHHYFRWLAANPNSSGQDVFNDSAGRPYFVSLCGPFLVVHWADHAAKAVRIVQIRQD